MGPHSVLDEALPGAVAQHDVDGVPAQFFQGGLHMLFGQGPISLGMGLGGQGDGTLPALEPPGNVLVGAVEGGGIDEGDAAFHRGADHPGAFLHGQGPLQGTHGQGAQAQPGHRAV